MLGIARGEEVAVSHPGEESTEESDEEDSNEVDDPHHGSIEDSCDEDHSDDPTRVSTIPDIFQDTPTTLSDFFEIFPEEFFLLFFLRSESRLSEK